jgi:chaperonin cofactor prefoldin
MGKLEKMSNEEIVDELLHEAEKLRVREEVLESARRILELNPKMDRVEAYRLSLDNVKLHAGLNY